MAFWLNVLALLKRRTVVLAAASVAVLLAVAAFLVLPNRQVSNATLVLTTAPTSAASVAGDSSVPEKINPLLNFSDGLNTALSIIVQVMNTDQVLHGLEDGSHATITISDVGGAEFLGNKGPFLFLTGESSSSAQAAQDIVVRAAKQVNQELADRQRSLNAPESQLISTLWVVEPTAPTASMTVRLEGTGVALFLGFALTLSGAYYLDVRRTRKGREGNPSEAGITDGTRGEGTESPVASTAPAGSAAPFDEPVAAPFPPVPAPHTNGSTHQGAAARAMPLRRGEPGGGFPPPVNTGRISLFTDVDGPTVAVNAVKSSTADAPERPAPAPSAPIPPPIPRAPASLPESVSPESTSHPASTTPTAAEPQERAAASAATPAKGPVAAEPQRPAQPGLGPSVPAQPEERQQVPAQQSLRDPAPHPRPGPRPRPQVDFNSPTERIKPDAGLVPGAGAAGRPGKESEDEPKTQLLTTQRPEKIDGERSADPPEGKAAGA
jgi:hypothetical protein